MTAQCPPHTPEGVACVCASSCWGRQRPAGTLRAPSCLRLLRNVLAYWARWVVPSCSGSVFYRLGGLNRLRFTGEGGEGQSAGWDAGGGACRSLRCRRLRDHRTWPAALDGGVKRYKGDRGRSGGAACTTDGPRQCGRQCRARHRAGASDSASAAAAAAAAMAGGQGHRRATARARALDRRVQRQRDRGSGRRRGRGRQRADRVRGALQPPTHTRRKARGRRHALHGRFAGSGVRAPRRDVGSHAPADVPRGATLIPHPTRRQSVGQAAPGSNLWQRTGPVRNPAWRARSRPCCAQGPC